MHIPESIYPLAKMGGEVLLINKENIPHIGKEKAFEVLCVLVNLENAKIYDMTELEKHLKFNPWEEIMDDSARAVIKKLIETKFSDADILEKIVRPLEKNKIA